MVIGNDDSAARTASVTVSASVALPPANAGEERNLISSHAAPWFELFDAITQ